MSTPEIHGGDLTGSVNSLICFDNLKMLTGHARKDKISGYVNNMMGGIEHRVCEKPCKMVP